MWNVTKKKFEMTTSRESHLFFCAFVYNDRSSYSLTFLACATCVNATMARRNNFTIEEYFRMVLYYGEAGGAPGRSARAARLWSDFYQRPLDPRTIDNTVRRLMETGSLLVRNPNGGRPRNQRDRFREPILEAFAEDPTTSLRVVARELSEDLNARVTYSMVQRVMKEDGQHAYHYRRVQDLRKFLKVCNLKMFNSESKGVQIEEKQANFFLRCSIAYDLPTFSSF